MPAQNAVVTPPRALPSVRAASPYLLSLLLLAAGVNHFVNPEAYDRLVPRSLPAHRTITYVSGLAELVCAAAVATPRSRRAGGWLTAALFVAVFPANVQLALDGGFGGSSFFGSATAAWLRLPLQVPLIAWAVQVARATPSPSSTERRPRRVV